MVYGSSPVEQPALERLAPDPVAVAQAHLAEELRVVGHGPPVEGGPQIKNMEPSSFHQTIGMPFKGAGEIPPFLTYIDSEKITDLENLSEDLALAARHALLAMIDHIVRTRGLSPEQAYILASVAVDLRVGQVVDVPNYVVTAVLSNDVFVE